MLTVQFGNLQGKTFTQKNENELKALKSVEWNLDCRPNYQEIQMQQHMPE